MRVLFFILGSIEKRVIAWEIEGFNSLFEQDIIFWGPIPDEKFVYKNKEIPIISISEQTTMNAILNKLPEGWYPDIVTCETSALNYVPDIYLCPVKTILFTRDAWADTIYNRGLTELFDFLAHAVIDMPIYKMLDVNVLPLSNFAISSPPNNVVSKKFANRGTDVIAIATCNSSFYHERYKTLYKLVENKKRRLKIRVFDGIKRSEIYKYYQKSKIVLDRAHTLSNRSYEAALNGCLLFSHEDNILINDFWTPWEEYIPYNDDNLAELIDYYIQNPELSESIILKTRQKVNNLPVTWGEMVWLRIGAAYNWDVSIQERIKRSQATPNSILHYRTATPLIYNYYYGTNFPANWKELYFKRIDNIFSEPESKNNIILPLIEAARMAYLFRETSLSLKYLNKLQTLLPDYAWNYYLKGRIHCEHNEYKDALIALRKAIESGLKAPELLQRFVLPGIENGSTCDGRRITDYLWQSVYNHSNEFQVRALLHMSFDLYGYTYERIEDQQNAIISYSQAIKYLPVPDCIYRLSPLLIRSADYKKLLEITGQGLQDSPYDSVLVLYHVQALLQLNNRFGAIRILQKHKKALKSFKGIRKILRLRILLNLIIPFVIFGKHPGAEIIGRLAEVMVTKAGIKIFD